MSHPKQCGLPVLDCTIHWTCLNPLRSIQSPAMSAAGLTPASPSVVSSAWISVCLTRNAATASKQWQRLCASWSFWQKRTWIFLIQNVLRQWATTWIFLFQNVLRQWGFDQFWCDPWNATISGVFWYSVAFFKWTHSYLCSQNGCNKATMT